jgi:hypothetical protein
LIAIDRIKTDDVLQPRCERLVPLKDKHRVAKASDEHVTRLCMGSFRVSATAEEH